MKGKIDSKGILHIQRGAKLKQVKCPFTNFFTGNNNEYIPNCGDWCAKFGEPMVDIRLNLPSHVWGGWIPRVAESEEAGTVDKINLGICHGQTLIFEEFEDERV